MGCFYWTTATRGGEVGCKRAAATPSGTYQQPCCVFVIATCPLLMCHTWQSIPSHHLLAELTEGGDPDAVLAAAIAVSDLLT